MPPKAQLYEPVSEVRPQGPRDPTEHVHIAYPEVQLTGAVGKAMEVAGHMQSAVGHATGFLAQNLDNLGKQFEHAGDEIFNRAVGLQELQNETAAKKAAIEYDTYETQQSVAFSQKQGDAATEDALKAHVADLQKKRDDMANKMANPSQKRTFDNMTMGSLVSASGKAAAHAAKETRAAANGATDGRIAITADKFAKTDDIQESDRLYQEVYKEFWGTKVPLRGWTKDEANAEWLKVTSHMYSSKITELSHGSPDQAMKMLEENKDAITASDYERVYKTVETELRGRNSRNIADRIQQGNPDAPLEDKIERGRKEAERINPKDERLVTETEGRIITQHNIMKKEQAEQKQKNWDTAKDAVYGYNTPTGAKPTTKEDYLAIPGARAAFDSLSDTDKDKILEMLVKNSKADYPLTPAARDRNNALKDEAESTDPAEVEKFLHRNLYDEKIPGSMRDQLREKQREIAKRGAQANPSVMRAMRVVGNSLPNTFRDPTSSIGKEFRGALQVILEDELAANKGVPLKDERIREIVGQLMSEKGGWGGWFTSYVYKDMVEPSDETLRQMKNLAPWKSEMELKADFTKMKWKTYSDEWEKLKTQGKVPPVQPSARKTRSGPTVPQSQ
jgi:hypothetical protein